MQFIFDEGMELKNLVPIYYVRNDKELEIETPLAMTFDPKLRNRQLTILYDNTIF